MRIWLALCATNLAGAPHLRRVYHGLFESAKQFKFVFKIFNPLQVCGGLVCMIFPAFHAGLLIFIPFGNFGWIAGVGEFYCCCCFINCRWLQPPVDKAYLPLGFSLIFSLTFFLRQKK